MQTLEPSLECTHAVFRSNLEPWHSFVKYCILSEPWHRLLVNRNGADSQCVCRINPCKFSAIEEPIWKVDSGGMLECSRVMYRTSEAMTVVNDMQVWGDIPNLLSVSWCISPTAVNPTYLNIQTIIWFLGKVSITIESRSLMKHDNYSIIYDPTLMPQATEPNMSINPSLFNFFFPWSQWVYNHIMEWLKHSETMLCELLNCTLWEAEILSHVPDRCGVTVMSQLVECYCKLYPNWGLSVVWVVLEGGMITEEIDENVIHVGGYPKHWLKVILK